MAGLINRRGLGSQPASTGVSMAGRHNRGGGPRHISRGGGGGGGGGGGRRLPNVGLYHGKAGAAQANRNPEAYFRAVMQRGGGLDYSGTPISDFSELAVQKLMDEYFGAQAGRQRLAATKFLKNTYGAGFMGNKSRNFNAGTLFGEGGAVEDAATTHYSNTRPDEFLYGQEGGGGGNAQFDSWLQEVFNPGVVGQARVAQAADPNLNINDLVAGRDLMGEARRRYLARPNAQRNVGPINLGARYSWWE